MTQRKVRRNGSRAFLFFLTISSVDNILKLEISILDNKSRKSGEGAVL